MYISKLSLSQILPEQTGCNWTCPCAEDNHPLRAAPTGGTALTRPDHPKQRGPCGRKHAFCGATPQAKCLYSSGCGCTLQMNSVVNDMITTSPRIGSTPSRTTDRSTITALPLELEFDVDVHSSDLCVRHFQKLSKTVLSNTIRKCPNS